MEKCVGARNKSTTTTTFPDENTVKMAEEGQSNVEYDLVDGGIGSVGVVTAAKEKDLTVQEEKEKAHQTRFSRKTRLLIRRFRYYFRHPYFRLFVAYFVTICNFFIYAEDPVAHSHSGCTIPLIGNDYAFLFDRYPSGGYSALKVFLWFLAILLGILVGKFLIHRLLFRRAFKLSMFSNCQGSWMVMFFSTLVTLFIFSFIYNGLLSLGGSAYAKYKISTFLGIQNRSFMKVAALGTWLGDFVTAWMVTDMMLQEKSRYPWWAKKVRAWWSEGWNRVILFWVVLVILTIIVATAILTDYINWDKLNRDVAYTNELGRAFLASFILLMDFLIVMQDWDFPMFSSNFDIKLPGLNTAHIHFRIPDCLRKEHWDVHISGKWFNYGILFMVMLLDLNMWKNQIFYTPFDYGQYTGPDGKIYSVLDTAFIKASNKTTMSYGWRWNHFDPLTNQTLGSKDIRTNSRYRHYSLGLKSIAFFPSILTFIIFGVLIWIFGREHTFGSVASLTVEPTKVIGTGTSLYPDEKRRVDGGDSNDGGSIVVERLEVGKESSETEVTRISSDPPKTSDGRSEISGSDVFIDEGKGEDKSPRRYNVSLV